MQKVAIHFRDAEERVVVSIPIRDDLSSTPNTLMLKKCVLATARNDGV